mmetsp:Transcript_44562/g.93244  ORF Transcript_44562/g.93244 Transcript_44562/m.93244 type:complete len:164 (+) Transcript_44562:3211-3702(+)
MGCCCTDCAEPCFWFIRSRNLTYIRRAQRLSTSAAERLLSHCAAQGIWLWATGSESLSSSFDGLQRLWQHCLLDHISRALGSHSRPGSIAFPNRLTIAFLIRTSIPAGLEVPVLKSVSVFVQVDISPGIYPETISFQNDMPITNERKHLKMTLWAVWILKVVY